MLVKFWVFVCRFGEVGRFGGIYWGSFGGYVGGMFGGFAGSFSEALRLKNL